MSSVLILNTAWDSLETLTEQFLAALDGIPDEDLNSWKPSAELHGGGPMNTFAALSVHVVAAASWRIEQQLFDKDYERDRESEFTATASRAEIDARFAAMLGDFRDHIDSGQEVDLESIPNSIRDDHPDWTRYEWLISAIQHTALHLGHAQIHRQLWLAEKSTAS